MKSKPFVLLSLMALASCASRMQPVPPDPVTCPKPPAVDAWILQPAQSSLPLLDKLFSISEPASPAPSSNSPPAKPR